MADGAGVGAGYRDRSPRGQGPRRVRVSLRYTDIEWAAILVAAAAEGMKPGAWVADAAGTRGDRHVVQVEPFLLVRGPQGRRCIPWGLIVWC